MKNEKQFIKGDKMKKKKYGLGSMKGSSTCSKDLRDAPRINDNPKVKNLQKLSSIATTTKKIKGSDRFY